MKSLMRHQQHDQNLSVQVTEYVEMSLAPLTYGVRGTNAEAIQSVGYVGLYMTDKGMLSASSLPGLSHEESQRRVSTWLPSVEPVLPEAKQYDANVLQELVSAMRMHTGPLALFQLGKQQELGNISIAANRVLGEQALIVKRAAGLRPAIETSTSLHTRMSKEKLKRRQAIGEVAYEAIIAGYAVLKHAYIDKEPVPIQSTLTPQ